MNYNEFHKQSYKVKAHAVVIVHVILWVWRDFDQFCYSMQLSDHIICIASVAF
jgi:hypothetical protein